MPEYRRWYVPGGTFFFTVVTQDRQRILTTDLSRQYLREAWQEELRRAPFEQVATVLLPDHLHTIWTLPPGDADYSTRWGKIKEAFTRTYLAGGGKEGRTTQNRRNHRERAVWQPRFWEHTIRDEDDLKRCLDYIHWNPVKHGLVQSVRDYPWSTFERWVQRGEYDPDWGGGFLCPTIPGVEWE
jgi:putative transposase